MSAGRGPTNACAVLLACVLLTACDPVLPEIGFEARGEAGQLAIKVRAVPETTTHLVYGRAWEGADPILPYAPGAAFKLGNPDGRGLGFQVLQTAAIPPELPLDLKFDAEFLPEGEGLIQLVATYEPKIVPGTAFQGMSRAYVVRRDGAKIEVRRFGETMFAEQGLSVVLMWAAIGVVILSVCLLPTRILRFHAAGRVFCAIVLLACLALRVFFPEADRSVLDRGTGVTPLVWPAAWEIGGDGWERSLGPGFRALWERAEQLHEETGEPVHIRCPVRPGMPLKRARCLELLIDAATLLFTTGDPPHGLVVTFSMEPVGDVLLQTGAGSLSRFPGKEKR